MGRASVCCAVRKSAAVVVVVVVNLPVVVVVAALPVEVCPGPAHRRRWRWPRWMIACRDHPVPAPAGDPRQRQDRRRSPAAVHVTAWPLGCPARVPKVVILKSTATHAGRRQTLCVPVHCRSTAPQQCPCALLADISPETLACRAAASAWPWLRWVCPPLDGQHPEGAYGDEAAAAASTDTGARTTRSGPVPTLFPSAPCCGRTGQDASRPRVLLDVPSHRH